MSRHISIKDSAHNHEFGGNAQMVEAALGHALMAGRELVLARANVRAAASEGPLLSVWTVGQIMAGHKDGGSGAAALAHEAIDGLGHGVGLAGAGQGIEQKAARLTPDGRRASRKS